MSAAGPSDEQIRAAALEVLSREEYARFRWVDPDWIPTLQGWLEGYLGWLRALAETSPWLLVLLVLGLLAVAALLIAHIVWSLRVALRGRPGGGEREAVTTRRDFGREAALLAERGDLLGACRALQLACLDLLLRGGTVELARHDGNATLRARLRRSSLPAALREELIAGIDALERSWFRDRTPSAELYAAWQRIHRDLAGAVT